MTAPRFLAFAGEPARLKHFLLGLVPEEHPPHRLNRALDSEDLVIFVGPQTPLVRMANGSGLLVGRLFTNAADCRSIARLGEGASAQVAASGGMSLLVNYWGNYAAFLRNGRRTTVLRDPSAAVPVFHASTAGIRIYFSDPDLRPAAMKTASVDEEFLRQWLTYPYLRTRRTGLTQVSELLPGTAHRIEHGAASTETLWTPWIAASKPQITNFQEAAAEVRSTVLRTVPAQLRERGRLALELSGGLDSSIVAAALANSGLFFPAVNFATRLPDGDEKHYARAVASHLGITLSEVVENRDPLDLRPGSAAGLRPGLSPVLQPLNRALTAFAREQGSDGLITGGGGDNIFCYLTTAAPILDAVRDLGLVRGASSTLFDVASVVECTVWKAGRYALRKHASRTRRPRWRRDDRFLAPQAAPERMDLHPWLEAPRDAPPGKREHVDSLIRALHFMEPRHPTGEAIIHPLINQPLIELCLSIPTWLWVQGGRNRAVARRAFEDRLPPEAINRRTKGRLESLCARAFEDNRRRLAELLLDGELASRRLLEMGHVKRYLQGSGPAPDDDYFRLFELASLELWLRSGPR
jgi:asparagine synthase (glutamine-hydrolysing)